MLSEGCSRHRRARSRNRDRDRVEETSRHHNDDKDDSYSSSSALDTEERMESLAQTDDYDGMLKALDGAVSRLRSIKKSYFAGKLTDRELQEELQKLQEDYQPIIDKLNKAQDNGDLNYKQHKKQMALVGAFYKEWEEAAAKIIHDFANEIK